MFKWFTTAASGRSHTHWADDGQVGWRIHLVNTSSLVDKQVRLKYGKAVTPHGPALCGLSPRYGWGIDLFIDEPCKRCTKAAEKAGIDWQKIL